MFLELLEANEKVLHVDVELGGLRIQLPGGEGMRQPNHPAKRQKHNRDYENPFHERKFGRNRRDFNAPSKPNEALAKACCESGHLRGEVLGRVERTLGWINRSLLAIASSRSRSCRRLHASTPRRTGASTAWGT